MNREHSFEDRVKAQVHVRQAGVCAHCGTSVSWEYDKTHAVIPFVERDVNLSTSHWLKEADNCVMLCFTCYTWVFVEPGAVGDPSGPEDFPFSHGQRNSGAHKEWVNKMMGRVGH